MFKVNNRITRTRCEICSKLTIKIRRHVSIVNFEQVNAGWDYSNLDFEQLENSSKIIDCKSRRVSRNSVFHFVELSLERKKAPARYCINCLSLLLSSATSLPGFLKTQLLQFLVKYQKIKQLVPHKHLLAQSQQ